MPLRIIVNNQATCSLIYSQFRSTFDRLSRRRKHRSKHCTYWLFVLRSTKKWSDFFVAQVKMLSLRKMISLKCSVENKCSEQNTQFSKNAKMKMLNSKKMLLLKCTAFLIWKKKQKKGGLITMLTKLRLISWVCS